MAENALMKRHEGNIRSIVGNNSDLIKSMGINPEAYERICLNALIRNWQDISQCSPPSVVMALTDAAQIGLMPDGREGALVRFGDTLQFLPMVQGRRKLARQGLPGLNIRTRLVYRDDEFAYEEGAAPVLRHVPDLLSLSRDDDDIVFAYSIAQHRSWTTWEAEVMTRDEINAIRGRARAQKGPWQTHYGEMARKTVEGRLLKRLPWGHMPGEDDTEDVIEARPELEAPPARVSVPVEDVQQMPAIQGTVGKPEAADWGPPPPEPAPPAPPEAEGPPPVGEPGEIEEYTDPEDSDTLFDDGAWRQVV